MYDLSLSYLFQIYTATPLVFTYMYKVVFWSNTLNGVAVKLNFLNVHPFEIWEHGGQTGQRDLEPNEAQWKGTCYQLKYCKLLEPSFQPRQLTDRRKQWKAT